MAPGALDTYRDAVWSLAEFVDAVNALLPDYLPKDASGRLADEVNPRLVRHYATLGLLPEPGKEGREARYLFEHLLHLLVVRKLLAEGFGSSAIRDAVAGCSVEELTALLEGTVRVALVPQGPSAPVQPMGAARPTTASARARAELLREVRAKAGLGRAAPDASSSTPIAPKPSTLDALAPAWSEPVTSAPRASAPATSASFAPASATSASGRPAAAPMIEPAAAELIEPAGAPTAAAATAPSSGTPPVRAAALDADERFQASLASIFRPSAWTRVRVDEGLELHVRDDYRLPRNRAGDEELLRLLKAVLLDLEQRSKGRP